MPVKILLADKSITIQKVVEMLFSGKEFEVVCVSDGETALSEAARIIPDVVLADVDLPRVDGYRFAARLKEIPALKSLPVILMLSRDDQYDAAKGKQASIVDSIAKPFESQDLISKVKKALAAAPVQRSTAAPAPVTPQAPRPAAFSAEAISKTVPVPPTQPASPRQVVPPDILDMIKETTPKEVTPPQPSRSVEAEEEIFEVEPEFEAELDTASPSGPARQATKSMPSVGGAPPVPSGRESRPGTTMHAPEPLDRQRPITRKPASEPEIVKSPFEPEAPLAAAPETKKMAPKPFELGDSLMSEAEMALPVGEKAMEEMRAGLGLGKEPRNAEAIQSTGAHPDIVSFESLDAASRVAHEEYTPPSAEEEPFPATPETLSGKSQEFMEPPMPPTMTDDALQAVSRETVEKLAREILERVAWEIVPELAERLIREEIKRLQAGS
jgi:CheY-like chemotaxis protein